MRTEYMEKVQPRPRGYGTPTEGPLPDEKLSFEEFGRALYIAEASVTADRKQYGFLPWPKAPGPTLREIELAFHGHESGVWGLLNHKTE